MLNSECLSENGPTSIFNMKGKGRLQGGRACTLGQLHALDYMPFVLLFVCNSIQRDQMAKKNLCPSPDFLAWSMDSDMAWRSTRSTASRYLQPRGEEGKDGQEIGCGTKQHGMKLNPQRTGTGQERGVECLLKPFLVDLQKIRGYA